MIIVTVIVGINCFATVMVNNWLSGKSPPCQDYRILLRLCLGLILYLAPSAVSGGGLILPGAL